MKTAVPPLAVFCILAATASLLGAEPSAVRIRAEQSNQVESKKFQHSQKRSLKVYVTNGSSETLDLKVKYTFFGRDVKGHDFVTVEQGEKPFQIKAHGAEAIETNTAKAAYVDSHLEGKGAGAKKVEESGTKFVGYAVQVLQGENIVAELYEPPSIKEQLGKAGPPKGMPPPKK